MSTDQGDLGLETPQEFSTRLGLTFQDISILSRALTHRSYMNENIDAIEDNERLEFVGDAVLDQIVATWLYHRFPESAEGHLTRLRSALVNKDQLAEFGIRIGVEKAVMLGRGEEEGGGRLRETLLCATFEAVIGALCLDNNLEVVREFMLPMLEDATTKILAVQGDKDPKSHLQEWAQSKQMETPSYNIVSEEGPDHNKMFEVDVIIDGETYGHGTGRSKQEASKTAARQALSQLKLI